MDAHSSYFVGVQKDFFIRFPTAHICICFYGAFLYSLDFFGFFTEIIMLVLLALLPFATMCINVIVCALGNVDSVSSFTLCVNAIVYALGIVDSLGFFTLCHNVHQCDCVCTWYR